MSGFNQFVTQDNTTEPADSGFNAFNDVGNKDFTPPPMSKGQGGFNQFLPTDGVTIDNQADKISDTGGSKPASSSSFADFLTTMKPGTTAKIGTPESAASPALVPKVVSTALSETGDIFKSSVKEIFKNPHPNWNPNKTARENIAAHPETEPDHTILGGLGENSGPLLGSFGAITSPVFGAASAIGQEAIPENKPLGSAVGQAIAGVGLAALPLLHAPEIIKPIEIDRSNPPVLDSQLTRQTQDEALANLSMSAKQPWGKESNPNTTQFEGLTSDQITSKVAEDNKQKLADIDAKINMYAANTERLGYKTALAKLQKEKQDILNPQGAIDRGTASVAEGKITDEQFQTNIAEPVQKALNSGVPVARVKAELTASLPAHFEDSYKQELIDRAIPALAQNAADSAPTVAKTTGIPEEEVQKMVLPPENGLTDTTSPNVIKEAAGLNAKQVKAALAKPTSAVWWTKLINRFEPLNNLTRAYARETGIDVGRMDMLERAGTAPLINIAERENGVGLSYLGSQDGSSMGVQELVPGQSQTKVNTEITPYNTIILNTKNMGADDATITTARATFNAADNYANADRVAQEAIKEAQSLRIKVAQLQNEVLLPENKGYFANRKIQNAIANLTQEIAAKQKLVKSVGERETYMTREEVATNLSKYKDNPAIQYLIDEMSKLNDSALQNLVHSGKITQLDADRMRAANPHYTPAWREADDYAFDLVKNNYTGNVSDAFQRRDISAKGKEQIDFAGNQIQYFLNVANKAQEAQVKGMIFNYLLKITDDTGWEAVIREPKALVQKALNEKTGKIYAEDIMPANPNKFENYDTVTFPINGKQIQLSIKDPKLFASISEAYRNPDSVARWTRPLQILSQLKVNLLTKWNPAFNIRNIERAMVDQNFNTLDGRLFRNYVPGASQLKVLGQQFYTPELYAKFRQEYGITDPLVREYQGLKTDEIVAKLQNGPQPNSILKGLDNVLTGFADRGDFLARGLEYQLTYKKAIKDGLTENAARDAALIAAKNIHLNFSQKGASGNFNAVVATFPFGRAFVNAFDKQSRFLIYAPKAAALGAANIYIMYKGLQTWNNTYVSANGEPVDNKVDKRFSDSFWWVRYGPDVNDIFKISNGWFGGHWGKPTDMTLALAAKSTGQYLDKVLETQGNSLVKQAQKMFPEVPMKNLTGKDIAEAWSNAVTKIVTPDSLAPAVVGTFAGWMVNKNNEGNPIVPDAKDGTPASLQYFTGSTDYAVAGMTKELATKGIEVSPGAVQFFARELGGAFGEGTLVAGAHVYGMMTGKNYPMPERGEWPGFSLISGNTSDIPHQGIEAQYYKTSKEIASIETRYAAYEKKAKDYPEYAPLAQQYRLDHANELHYVNEFKEASAYLAKIKNLISKVANADRDHLLGYQDIDPSILGDKTKRKAIDDLQIQAETRMQNVLDNIKQDMENGNSYANDLYHSGAQYNNNALSDIIEGIWPSGAPNKVNKNLDKSDNSEYNKGSNPFISDANASEGKMYDIPPAIHQEAPQEILDQQYKPGMWEKFFPNITSKVEGMYKDNIINYTMKQEGGDKFTQTPGDRGGATKFGITLRTLQEANPKATPDDVKNLTEQQARDIYTKNYWDKGQIEKMPIGVQDLVFDMNVNHGLGGSAIIIQRALNDLGADIDEDGKIGNNTLNAMNDFKSTDLRAALVQERNKWVEDIAKTDPSQGKFLAGWKRRIAGLEQIPEEVKAEEV